MSSTIFTRACWCESGGSCNACRIGGEYKNSKVGCILETLMVFNGGQLGAGEPLGRFHHPLGCFMVWCIRHTTLRCSRWVCSRWYSGKSPPVSWDTGELSLSSARSKGAVAHFDQFRDRVRCGRQVIWSFVDGGVAWLLARLKTAMDNNNITLECNSSRLNKVCVHTNTHSKHTCTHAQGCFSDILKCMEGLLCLCVRDLFHPYQDCINLRIKTHTTKNIINNWLLLWQRGVNGSRLLFPHTLTQ